MKTVFRPMLVALLFIAAMLSCNNEELFVQPTTENPPVDATTSSDSTNTGGTTPEDIIDPTNVTTPCDFDLSTASSGDTIIIDCMMDLNGQTVNLPTNVTIVYEGGDIINGTLNFSDNSMISGELLNSSVTLSGSTPQLKDTTFKFDPQRWGIVEGPTTSEIALRNRDILEDMFNKTKAMGATSFKIDEMDAYFKVDGPLNLGVPELHAINIPSDFNLVMSSNTHIRMQPNGHFRASLLAIYNEKNITITGGFLHGDREQHDYNSGYVDSDGSTGNSNEWVNTMAIKGGENITVDGVTFQDATGDGLVVSSIYFYFDSKHIRSKNITIKNSKFLRARRINLTLVNCEQVFIDNNEFIDGGIDMPNSKGTAPSCDFNMEPVRAWNNGNLVEYERVSDVYIRNNYQHLSNPDSNPKAGGFYFSHGNGPIVFENNEVNSKVSFSTVQGIIIRNNTINGTLSAGLASNINRTDFVFDNEVYGNKISDGVFVGGNGTTIRDNEIEGDVGIYLGAGAKDNTFGVSNTLIKNNLIKCTQRGIMTTNTITNTTIEGNTIDMLAGSTFAFNLYNTWSENGASNFIVQKNDVTGTKGNETGAPASIIGANSISVLNNNLGTTQITGGSNTIFKFNKIDAEINKDGLMFNSDCPNSTFTNNEITIYTSKTPLSINHIKIKENLQLSSSTLIDNNTFIEK